MINYKNEVTNYGLSLKTEVEKEVAREVFRDHLLLGRTYQWLYWAIYQLSERNIIQYRFLFFNREFIEQVDRLVTADNMDIERLKQQQRAAAEQYEAFCKERDSREIIYLKKPNYNIRTPKYIFDDIEE